VRLLIENPMAQAKVAAIERDPCFAPEKRRRLELSFFLTCAEWSAGGDGGLLM